MRVVMKAASPSSFLKVPRVIGLALVITFALAAHAQQGTNAAPSKDEIIQQLLQRVNELETKMKQVEEKQAVPPAPAPAPEPVVEAPAVHAVADRLRFNVFGDVGYRVSDQKGLPNTFELGSLDLFMTARLSDKVSALGEILFLPGTDNGIAPDI